MTFSKLEWELLQALRKARILLCSEGDPDEDAELIAEIDNLLGKLDNCTEYSGG